MDMKQQIKQRSNRSKSGITARGNLSGFSFMEVMTAMFVVSVGLVTVISLFSKGLINSAIDRDRIVAAGLAQEGVEIVKNIRDNELAIPGNVDGFSVANGLIGHNHCHADYTSTALSCFPNANSPETKFSLVLSGGKYAIAGTAQKFSRYINIDYHAGGSYADVISVVYWKPEWSTDITGADRIFSGGTVHTENCHAGNKCVYAQMRLETWKP